MVRAEPGAPAAMPSHLRPFAPLFAAYALLLAVSWMVLGARGIAVSEDSWTTLALTLALAGALVGGALISRNERALLAALTAASFLAMAPALAIFSYAMASAGASRPLFDAAFARIDAAMGFDWLATVAAVNEWPSAVQLLKKCYHWTIAAVMYAYVLLNVLNRRDRILELAWAMLLTCVLANLIAAAYPAVGAYVFHQPAAAIRDAISADSGVWHLKHFEALRAGTFALYDIRTTEGIVTFPSYHTAVALVVPIALRGLGPVTAAAWVFAGLVVLSTVPIGGHYLIDVIAGAAMTVAVCALLARRCPASLQAPVPAAVRA